MDNMDNVLDGKEQSGYSLPSDESLDLVDVQRTDGQPLARLSAATVAPCNSDWTIDNRCHLAATNQPRWAEIHNSTGSLISYQPDGQQGPQFYSNNIQINRVDANLIPVLSSGSFHSNSLIFGTPAHGSRGTAASDDGVDDPDGEASNPGVSLNLNKVEKCFTDVGIIKTTVENLQRSHDDMHSKQNDLSRQQEDLATDIKELTKDMKQSMGDIKDAQVAMGNDLGDVKSAQEATCLKVKAIGNHIAGLDSTQTAMAEELAKMKLSQEEDRLEGNKKLQLIHGDTAQIKQTLMQVALQQQPDSESEKEFSDSVYAGSLRQHHEVLKRIILAMKVAVLLYSQNKLTHDAYQRICNAHSEGLLDEAGRLLLMYVAQGSEECHESFINALSQTDQRHLFDLLTREGFSIDETHVPVIRRNWTTLLKSIYVNESLISLLYQRSVLDDDDWQYVTAGGTQVDKVGRLLSLLCRKSYACYQQFLEALNETGQQHVAHLLILNSQEI